VGGFVCGQRSFAGMAGREECLARPRRSILPRPIFYTLKFQHILFALPSLENLLQINKIDKALANVSMLI